MRDGAFSSRDSVALRAQGIAALRGVPHRHLEDGVVAQIVAVVGVLIVRRNGEHPEPQHLLQRVGDEVRIAFVPQTRRKALGEPELLLDIAQQQNACVRRKHPAIEGGRDLLAGNRWKRKRQ